MDDQKVFIIGGSEVYRGALLMGIVSTMHVTLVHAHPSGDVCFPMVNSEEWEVIDSVRAEPDGKNEYAMIFREYRRK
jgi:dihydrofolate reductase